MGGGAQFAYVIIRGEGSRFAYFCWQGGGGVENCKEHAYVIFEQPLTLKPIIFYSIRWSQFYFLVTRVEKAGSNWKLS